MSDVRITVRESASGTAILRRSSERGWPAGYTHAYILTAAASGPVTFGAKALKEFWPETCANGGASPMATVQPRVVRAPVEHSREHRDKISGGVDLEDIFPKFSPTS